MTSYLTLTHAPVVEHVLTQLTVATPGVEDGHLGVDISADDLVQRLVVMVPGVEGWCVCVCVVGWWGGRSHGTWGGGVMGWWGGGEAEMLVVWRSWWWWWWWWW